MKSTLSPIAVPGDDEDSWTQLSECFGIVLEHMADDLTHPGEQCEPSIDHRLCSHGRPTWAYVREMLTDQRRGALEDAAWEERFAYLSTGDMSARAQQANLALLQPPIPKIRGKRLVIAQWP